VAAVCWRACSYAVRLSHMVDGSRSISCLMDRSSARLADPVSTCSSDIGLMTNGAATSDDWDGEGPRAAAVKIIPRLHEDALKHMRCAHAAHLEQTTLGQTWSKPRAHVVHSYSWLDVTVRVLRVCFMNASSCKRGISFIIKR